MSNSDDLKSQKEDLKGLIEELYKVKSDLSNEMALRAEANWHAKCEGNNTVALNKIQDAISAYPKSRYPIIDKFFIMLHFSDLKGMESTLVEMKGKGQVLDKEKIALSECYYYAFSGDKTRAYHILTHRLQNLPKSAKKQITKKVDNLLNRL